MHTCSFKKYKISTPPALPLRHIGLLVFLTDEAARILVFVTNADVRIGKKTGDGREQQEVETSDDVEQLVLREHIHQLVVHEHLAASQKQYLFRGGTGRSSTRADPKQRHCLQQALMLTFMQLLFESCMY